MKSVFLRSIQKKRGYNEKCVAETVDEVRGWVIACKHIIEYEN